ncbi:hypothetical protein GQ457_05G023020 [Hibiscus cannabinus]
MFDLALNTTLESKTLAAQLTLSFCADFPSSGNWVVRFLLVSGKEFPNFALLFIRLFQEEIKVVIFSVNFSLLRYLRDSGNEGVRFAT